MAKVRVIEVHENVFNTNNQEADALRKRLKDRKVTMINVMSSPGSGKTTLLFFLPSSNNLLIDHE